MTPSRSRASNLLKSHFPKDPEGSAKEWRVCVPEPLPDHGSRHRLTFLYFTRCFPIAPLQLEMFPSHLDNFPPFLLPAFKIDLGSDALDLGLLFIQVLCTLAAKKLDHSTSLFLSKCSVKPSRWNHMGQTFSQKTSPPVLAPL